MVIIKSVSHCLSDRFLLYCYLTLSNLLMNSSQKQIRSDVRLSEWQLISSSAMDHIIPWSALQKFKCCQGIIISNEIKRTINNTQNLWWLNQEPSTCPLGRVQNQFSDNGKLRKNHNIKSKLAQKLYDENMTCEYNKTNQISVLHTLNFVVAILVKFSCLIPVHLYPTLRSKQWFQS